MSNYKYSIDKRLMYQPPKKQFGEILNAYQVTPRNIDKDLMVHTQKTSEVKNLSKGYPQKTPNHYFRFFR